MNLRTRITQRVKASGIGCGLLIGLGGAIAVGRAADAPHGVRVTASRVTGLASFVTSADGGAIPAVAPGGLPVESVAEFLTARGHLFGLSDSKNELMTVKTEIDALAHRHTTFQQVYRGVRVFSGVLKIHQDVQGQVIAANGDFYPIKPTLDVRPVLSLAEAIEIAQRELGSTGATAEHAELVVVDPGWYGDRPLGARLAYHIVLSNVADAVDEAFLVDAQLGSVLDRWSKVCWTRARSIHDFSAGSDCCYEHGGNGCDDATCEALVCEQRPACCADGWTRACASLNAQLCSDSCYPGPQVRSEDDPLSGNVEVDKVYDYAGDIYDYLFRAFDRDSLEGAGLPLVATVNWTLGGCPNAFWDDTSLAAVFCPETTSDDIVAHEFTHGLTGLTAGLIYQNQSGQLNESFSDVFGELVDLFNGDSAFLDEGGSMWPSHDTGPGLDSPNLQRSSCSFVEDGYPDGVRWLVAEGSAFDGAIRDMWNPTCHDDPDRTTSELQTCDIIDAGGVHSGSGIPNHAFALLTDGGSFNGYDVRGIGPIKSGAVWYRALTIYLTIASDFQAAYAALNQAARDLVGTTSTDPRTGGPSDSMFTQDDADQVDRALLAVELDQTGRCGWTVPVLDSDSQDLCAGATVLFADDFEQADRGWTVSLEGPFGPPTPYDWVRTSDSLPYGRLGTVWYCEDRDAGGCGLINETAVHSLFSPPILLPDNVRFPFLSFAHYLESEQSWDGGRLSVRLNGGAWTIVQGSKFEFNPYNSILHTSPGDDGNPLGGSEVWTGIGGQWGTSVLNLSTFATAGDTIEVRFDFGKDRCIGFRGWYVDDFVVYDCPNCNLNDTPDYRELSYTASSGFIREIGAFAPRVVTFEKPPPAAGDVKLSFSAMGDFNTEEEFLAVMLNGTRIGTVFEVGGADCPRVPNRDSIVISADVFNDAVGGQDASIRMTATDPVNANLCPYGTFVSAFIEYSAIGADANENAVPDECENCATALAPLLEYNGVVKNRYLSIAPGNPGRHTALLVTVTSLPKPFSLEEELQYWVGRPVAVAESAAGFFMAAYLGCRPQFLDWTGIDTVHVFGAAIVPGASYEVAEIDLACGLGAAEHYSSPTAFETALWGDVSDACQTSPCGSPNGVVSFDDVSAVVDNFRNVPGAITKTRADLSPAIPDRVVDFRDISSAVDAFRGLPYPFGGPAKCPDVDISPVEVHPSPVRR